MSQTPTSNSDTKPAAVAAESVVRQTNYFPMFADGGPHVGTLYTKTWRTVGVMGVTDEWTKRVAGYWERLEIKYGVIWSAPVIDYDELTGCIVTAATPIALIPGERYEVQG